MTERIPNQCHFVFGLKRQTEPFHLVHYLCLESCRQVLKPDRIFFHYWQLPYGPYWDLIRDRLELVRVSPVPRVTAFRYREHAISRYRYAHHADFIRLEQLLEHGGVYADIDTIFVNPIPAPLYTKPFVIGREPDIVDQASGQRRPSLCNAFLMAPRQSSFARRWLAEMPRAMDGSWSGHSTLLPWRLATAFRDEVYVEPQRTFYKHAWTREGIAALLEGCDRDFGGVVSMHLWSHLWWSRWRRDFSNVHAGRLTEEFVRSVDTTYNIVARRFLPESAALPPERGWRRHFTAAT